MSLELKLEQKGINALGTLLTLEDKTGNYDAGTNPGGWGAPNPERSSMKLFLYGERKTTKEVTSLDLGFINMPIDIADLEYEIPTEFDGYYEFTLIAVSDGAPTVEGEYGYDGTNIQKFVGGSAENKTIAEASKDVDLTTKDSLPVLVSSRAAITRNRLNLELTDAYKSEANDRAHRQEIDYRREKHDNARALLAGAMYNWYLGSYMNSQEIIESFEQFNE